ncbi:MAG TPA: hypothetical protein VLA32_06965 [Anaerolineales bacterium]|nr:hypothetical protein [Anaerolineales bacterium]
MPHLFLYGELMGYSYLNASTGSRLAARLAGYSPHNSLAKP